MSLVTGFANAVRLVALAVWDRVLSEPVLTLALVNAVILWAVAFGLNMTKEQVVVTGTLAAAILGWLARRQVVVA